MNKKYFVYLGALPVGLTLGLIPLFSSGVTMMILLLAMVFLFFVMGVVVLLQLIREGKEIRSVELFIFLTIFSSFMPLAADWTNEVVLKSNNRVLAERLVEKSEAFYLKYQRYPKTSKEVYIDENPGVLEYSTGSEHQTFQVCFTNRWEKTRCYNSDTKRWERN